MKDKKTNVWVPVAVIIGILLVAMIVLTVFMVVTGRSAGNTGSSSSKYHADSTQSDVKPQNSDDYIQDVSLDEFSIGESSDDSSASDNAVNTSERALSNCSLSSKILTFSSLASVSEDCTYAVYCS